MLIKQNIIAKVGWSYVSVFVGPEDNSSNWIELPQTGKLYVHWDVPSGLHIPALIMTDKVILDKNSFLN